MCVGGWGGGGRQLTVDECHPTIDRARHFAPEVAKWGDEFSLRQSRITIFGAVSNSPKTALAALTDHE